MTALFGLLFSSFSALAYNCKVNGIYYDLNTTDKTASVTNSSNSDNYSGVIVIPETIAYNGARYSVTSIGQHAFYKSEVTSVTIGNSVTIIGFGAFKDCSALTSVTIGNSVTSIGDWAFYDCSGLTSVTIPSSVISIGEFAFSSCSALTSVIIPNSVTSIGKGVFCYCSVLTSVTIGNSVTSIGECAFIGCYGLTSVTIGNAVTSIGESAFHNCSELKYVTIGNSVISIGQYAFYGCTELTSVTIPNSVKSIGDSAFDKCTGLINLVSMAIEPPACGNKAFNKVDKIACKLFVPKESINAYKGAEQWREFFFISEYDGVDDVSIGTPDAVYEVYNLQGVRVGSGMREAEITADALPHGVYILVSPQGRKKLKI